MPESRRRLPPQRCRHSWSRLASVLVVVLFSCVCLVPARAAARPSVRRITVVFRLDDYCDTTSRVGTELLAIFQKRHIPCTYGVIPYTSSEFSTDPASYVPIGYETARKLDDAVRSGLVEVALHGFTHTSKAAMPANGVPSEESEFRGLDYSSQFRMLSAGRGVLEGLYHVSVTTFIAPFNTYDANTLRALDDLGFEVISALSDGSHTGEGASPARLRFLPYTCEPADLREAVEAARRNSDPDALIVIMLHPYDFVEYGRHKGEFTYQSFADLLSWLAAQSDVATQTLGGAAKQARDLGPGRLEAIKVLIRSQRSCPGFLRIRRKLLFYPSTQLAHRMTRARRTLIATFYISLYLLLTAAEAILTWLVARPVFARTKTGSLPRIAKYATASLLGLYVICVSASALSRHAVRHRYIVVLAGLLAVCLGTWVAASAHRKRTCGK
jgi:hypothetical protein